MAQPSAHLIRTGILHCPELDLNTGEALRLRFAHLPTVGGIQGRFVFLHENYVAHSHNWIEDILIRWCDEESLDLVLTVGGTLPAPGPGPRERMPEATLSVLDRQLPGFGEAMRAHAGEFSELALLDRGVAGIRSQTLIINLPHGAGPACCFLDAVAHLIAPTVAHLQELAHAPQLAHEISSGERDSEPSADWAMADAIEEDGETGEQSDASPAVDAGLSEQEFAEFLRRRKR